MTATNFVKVTFDGTQDFVDVTLPATFTLSNIQAGGPIRVTLSTRSASVVRVEPAARFTGTIVLSQLKGYIAPTPPTPPTAGRVAYTGLQIVTLSNPSGSSVWARPLYIPSDVASIKLHFANKHVFGNIGTSATINIAVYVSDATQTNKVGALLGNYSSQVVPGDGGELVVGPIPVTRGVDGKVVIVYSTPATGNISFAYYDYHGWYINATEVVSPLAAPTGNSNYGIFFVHVEYASTSKRRFVVLGDSISINATNASDPSTTGGYEASCWYQLGLQYDYAVDIEGYGGAQLKERNDPTTYPALWGTFPNLAVEDVVIELAINDAQLTSAVMKTNLLGLIAKIQVSAPTRIWAVTAAPALAYITSDTYRTNYNTDLRANWASYGLAGIFDFDVALRDPTTPSQLLPAYSSDGTHWVAVGQNAALTVVKTKLGI